MSARNATREMVREQRGEKKLGVPDFTGAEWQASVTDEQLIASITNGKKKMPAQKHKLSQEEIKALVRYVRILAPRKRR